jgi:hypothetical protein
MVYNYSEEYIESMSNYQFPEGMYYYYDFSSLYETINVQSELERLRKNFVFVYEAWYRGPRNGCSPPGSNWTTTTMYKARLVVYMPIKNDKILDENYKIQTSPSKIPCGYNVYHYFLN